MMRTGRGRAALLELEEPAHNGDGAAPTPPPSRGEARRASAGREPPLFSVLALSNPARRRRAITLPLSLAAHAAVIATLVLIPIFRFVPPPEHTDYIRALLYDPPPPPPPPLPRGSPRGRTPRATKPASPEPTPRPAPVEPPRESPKMPAPRIEAEPPRDAKATEDAPAGSPTGSELGTPEGMEGGVEGGVVGGVPGGVVGGVIGGTGDIPVPVRDPDRPPRILYQTKPQYPQEAFVKKIEGTVLVEILIDARGRVVRARVAQSVRALDAAALEAVRQWVFAPAMKHGQPVATLAMAPVTFRIF